MINSVTWFCGENQKKKETTTHPNKKFLLIFSGWNINNKLFQANIYWKR